MRIPFMSWAAEAPLARRVKNPLYTSLLLASLISSCQSVPYPFINPLSNVQTLEPSKADTPLHQAIRAGADLAHIATLLEYTNQPDAQGNTPLHVATQQGQLPLVQLLLEYQAALEAKNKKGQTPLHLAAQGSNGKIVSLLLDRGALLEARDNHQRTPLHVAIKKGKPIIIQKLLRASAQIEAKDVAGKTPLHVAAQRNKIKSLKRLLAQGALLEARDNHQRTPLHVAAKKGKLPAIQQLLQAKAQIEAKDVNGKTPYDLATTPAIQQPLVLPNQAVLAPRSLFNLLFQCDEDVISNRVLGYLTLPERQQLRATYTVMNWKLLQKGAAWLQATPDKFLSLHPYTHARLYPHASSVHCGCPSFAPIPVELWIKSKKDVFDWEKIAKDKRFLIQAARYAGNIYAYKDVYPLLSEEFRQQLTVPQDALALVQNSAHSSSEDEQEYSKTASSQSEEAEEGPSNDEQRYSKTASSQSEEAEKDLSNDGQGYSKSASAQSEEAGENPSNDKQVYSKSASAESEEGYSDDEQTKAEDSASEPLAFTPADPGNQLYNSFVGVKKLPAGKVTIGDYLAAGAFGKVYRGQWGNKLVALKQINLVHARKNLYGTSYKRFYKGTYTDIPIGYEAIEEAMQWEVARLSTASHPNLVQFHGLYQDENEGYTYLVLEFCEGGTLQGELGKKHIPWSQRWQWALQISQALAYLHQEGVLHRDLKAENVLLDKNGRAKLADLGVAQVDALLQAPEAKVVKAGLQDRRFIAPELESDPTLSTQAIDIYALGLVFWQVASGKEPRRIDDLSSEEKEDWRRGRERETIPADCHESFKQLILECWEKDPNQRPTAQGVLAKLAALGPELDPYHHHLITAAQKLEAILHPKRTEGLSYIAPYITQKPIQESIETYWKQIEEAPVSEEALKNPCLDLTEVTSVRLAV